MKTVPVTVNMRPFKVTQFENMREAADVIPEQLLLKWVNAAWQNTQSEKLVGALRERGR